MAEGQNVYGSFRNRSLQKLLMTRFVWNANPHFVHEFKGESTDSECSWRKVTCSNGEISKIRIFDIEVGDLSVAYLPPKVQFFELSNCGFASTIETSLFPRESRVMIFEQNKIQGTVDLTRLPQKLVLLNLSENSIVGPISLTHLPKTFEALYISRNKIEQKVVYYANLPETLAIVNYDRRARQSGRDETIGTFRPVTTKDAVNERSVFYKPKLHECEVMRQPAMYWQRVYWHG